MSFTATVRQRSTPVLPLAGMVDVLFLLLIFFMTISAFREHDQQIDVALPSTSAGAPEQSPTQIVITVTADDELFIGDRSYTPEQLRRTLLQLGAQFPSESVVIRGDGGSRLGTSVAVMDMAYSGGLRNVYMATTESESAP
ncbi:MAG: hypothetical protein CMJ18_11170 [Phycisphaeraceae bacterium]|nr:hypothetical protein [Phycisphaeraceae bacterium]